jgi:ribonuclease P protein component
VAVVVGKKVAKKAVERNFIRRRLFEAIRIELPTTGPAFDIVVTVFDKEISQMEFDFLRRNIQKLFKTAQIL